MNPGKIQEKMLIYQESRRGRTCESLRLNLADAMDGKTWLLLPDGFRDQESGNVYPLPTTRAELQRLIVVPIPSATKSDSGCLYVKRAIEAFKKKNTRRLSASLDAGRSGAKIAALTYTVTMEAKKLRAEVRESIESVKAEADRAIASLNDLFALGREGIEGQMRAHLAGVEWKEEKVTARAFRECFRMVSQSVKQLGLPTEQRDKAREAVMEEVAKSVEATRSAISGSTDDDEVQH